jgi:hypothetical protein
MNLFFLFSLECYRNETIQGIINPVFLAVNCPGLIFNNLKPAEKK